ncbi:MAG: orotidine-5'-phosphate decarboxylase [Actinomycetes bacterium]
MSASPLILAIDTSDVQIAREWIDATKESVAVYKLGLEFFLKNGPAGVKALQEAADFELFLDLKLHDIAHTVAGASRSIAHLAPRFLTVHASGGSDMVAAAVAELPTTSVTGVTILTSLSATDLGEIGFRQPPLESAISLAKLATMAGARSIVCSPLEVSAIRDDVADSIEIITPGVRPEGSALGDQVRVMTPKAAMNAGANYFVIGRPITSLWQSDSPDLARAAMAKSAKAILDSL